MKQTIRETNILKYGSENVMGSNIIQEKRKNIFQEKYGVDHYSQTEEYKIKIKKTNLDRYGVEYYSQTDESKEKIRKTSLEIYGVDHPSMSEDVKETARNTNREKYGCDYYTQTEEYKLKRKKTSRKLSTRPVVEKIRTINLKYKISLTNGWYQKNTAVLEEMLSGLEKIENEIKMGISKEEITKLDFGFKFRFR